MRQLKTETQALGQKTKVSQAEALIRRSLISELCRQCPGLDPGIGHVLKCDQWLFNYEDEEQPLPDKLSSCPRKHDIQAKGFASPVKKSYSSLT